MPQNAFVKCWVRLEHIWTEDLFSTLFHTLKCFAAAFASKRKHWHTVFKWRHVCQHTNRVDCPFGVLVQRDELVAGYFAPKALIVCCEVARKSSLFAQPLEITTLPSSNPNTIRGDVFGKKLIDFFQAIFQRCVLLVAFKENSGFKQCAMNCQKFRWRTGLRWR